MEEKVINQSKYRHLGKLFLFLLTLSCLSCEGLAYLFKSELVDVTDLTVSPQSITMRTGDSIQLSASISPDNATYQELDWASSDSAIASVDNIGTVTAHTSGTAAVSVTTEKGGYSAESEILVIENQPGGYIISFDSTGGSFLDDVIVEFNNKVPEPTEPTLEHFIFDGWYRDDYYAAEWVFDQNTVKEDMTLYAKWTENFASSNKPEPEILSCMFIDDGGQPILTSEGDSIERTYKLQTPWNYEKDYNASREYPLVISLHGWTDITEFYYDPASFCGSTNMREYPCFFLAPDNHYSEDCPILDWDNDNAAWVRNIIGDLISSYRVDKDRIYIIGFSMGGSGSYYLAEDLYEDGIITAGIVRCAGMSYSDLPVEIAGKTSVWYNVGLDDMDIINEIADAAYEYMKGLPYFDEAIESFDNFDYDTINEKEKKTSTLRVNGIQAMKYSRYEGLGHSSAPVWQDPFTLKWLFHQSLEDR